MKSCFGTVVVVLCASTGFSVGTNIDGSNAPAKNGTRAEFESFCQSLGLSNSDVDVLWDKLSTGTSDIEAACLTAQTTLGEVQVDVTPLNKTVVNDNW